jgi:hypothetical protein
VEITAKDAKNREEGIRIFSPPNRNMLGVLGALGGSSFPRIKK